MTEERDSAAGASDAVVAAAARADSLEAAMGEILEATLRGSTLPRDRHYPGVRVVL